MEKIGTGKYKLLLDKNIKKGYTIINNTAILDVSLNCFDRSVYLYLLMRTYRGKKECFPAVRTIAGELNISVGQVSKSTQILRLKGYLDIRKGKKSSNIYEVRK